jgi:hypothetical protein
MHATSKRAVRTKDLTGLADFFYGLLVAILLLAAKVALVEHTKFGQKIERLGYEWLQSWVSTDKDTVLVIDTSKLVKVPQDLDITERDEIGEVISSKKITIPPVTPINELQKIVSAVVTKSPCAVGIDLNFAALKNT